MRKILFFLFPSFFALFVLSCSDGDSGMPCVSCGDRYYDYEYYAPSSSSSLSACAGGTVTIGDNTWSQTWQNCNSNAVPSTGNSRCYGGQESNCAIYGRLYDWAAAMALPDYCNSSPCEDEITTPHHRGICPSGYHIPTTAEWDELENYIEDDKNCTNCAAKHLKAQNGWYSCNVSGSSYYCLDEYGFSALPGGCGYSDGDFRDAGDGGLWWSASEYTSIYAYFRSMYYSNEYAYWNIYDKSFLFSVRCLQDYAD